MSRQVNINVNVDSTKAVTNINTLKKAFEELNRTIAKNGKDGSLKIKIDLEGVDIKKFEIISKSLSKITKNFDTMDKALKNISANGNTLRINVGNINNVMGGYEKTTEKATKKQKLFNSELLASVAILATLKRSFGYFSRDYLELTNRTFGVGIAGEMNISEIEKLNESFSKLSKTVPKSANELALAVDDLIRTGRSYDESRKIIEEVAKLSVASGDDLKSTAQVVTKVMVSLGVNADRTVDTLNTMHSTAIQTASDMRYLAEAYKNIAGTNAVFVASSGLAGEALDDYKQKVLDLSMASIGSMANLGLSASQAGTKIKQMFGRLTSAEIVAKNLFNKEMALNNVQIDGKAFNYDMLSAMAKSDLPKAVETMSKLYTQGKLSSQVLQKMFTARHFMEVSNLLLQINGNVDSFVHGIAQGLDYSNDMYKAMFNINEQAKLLKNNIKNSMQPLLEDGKKSLTGWGMILNKAFGKDTEGTTSSLEKGMNSLTLATGASVTQIVALAGAFRLLQPLVTSVGTSMSGLLTTLGVGATVSTGGAVAIIGAIFLALNLTLKEIGDNAYEAEKRIADLFSSLSKSDKSISSATRSVEMLETSIKMLKDSTKKVGDIDIETYIRDKFSIFDALASEYKEYYETVENLYSLDLMNADLMTSGLSKTEKKIKDITNSIKTYREELKKIQDENFYGFYRMMEMENPSSNSMDWMFKGKGFFKGSGLSDEERTKRIKDFYGYIFEAREKFSKDDDLRSHLYEVGLSDKYGFARKSVIDTILKNIDSSPYNETTNKIDELKDALKDTETEKSNRYRELEEYIKLAERTQDSWTGLMNKMSSDTFFKTGKIYLPDNVVLSGLDAVVYEQEKQMPNIINSMRSGIEKQISLAEQELVNITDEKTGVYEDEETAKRLKQNIESYKNSLQKLNELKDVGLWKLLGEDSLSFFKSLDYSKSTTKDIMVLMETLVKEALVDEKIAPEWKKALQEMIKRQKTKVVDTDKETKERKNQNKYSLKYISYKKEELDLELASLKLGKTKGQQLALEYEYKLKTYKINKELSEIEMADAKKNLEKYTTGIGGDIISKALSLDTNDKNSRIELQNLLKSFSERYGSEGRGETYKSLKEKQDALNSYVKNVYKAKKETDGLGIAIKNMLDDISKYSEEINPYEQMFDYSGKWITEHRQKVLEIFQTKQSNVWRAYNLGDMSVDEAMLSSYRELLDFQKLISSEEGKQLAINIYGLDTKDTELSLDEQLVSILEEKRRKYEDISGVKKNDLETSSELLRIEEKRLEVYSNLGGIFDKLGNMSGSSLLGDLGSTIQAFGDLQKFSKDPKNKFSFSGIFSPSEFKKEKGEIDWDAWTINLSKSFASALEHMSSGQVVGSLIGTAFGGGQSAQQAGTLAGLATGLAGMGGPYAMAIQAGVSLIGGLFDKNDKKQAEADKKTQESNKLYNRNTEALQELSKRMSELSGGVDSLNSSLISSFSKIPTVGNLDRVTDAMTSMYKTMEKTRVFNEVAYQVTKTKKSSGFFGIGASSTSWTETIKVSVQEMLSRYGFKGKIEDMTSDQLRAFSKWLDKYDMGDSDNFSVLADAIEDYTEALDKMEKNIENFFYDSTMESFEGITSLEQEKLRQQIEDFYKNLGFQIDENMSNQIDKLAEQMSVMVTVMQDVRSDFVSNWKDLGLDAGKTFVQSMKPYISSMLTNISQIYYDVYFSDINKNLEDEFKNMSEKLVELKRQGETLKWDSVSNELSNSFGKVINIINSTKDETESFNSILGDLQKQALESGLSLSEIFNLGLSTGTQNNVLESFRTALTSSEADSAFLSIGEMVGDTIGEALVDKLIDNIMGEKILELSSLLDKTVSGNLSFDSLAGVASEAMGVGLMLESERLRYEALRDLFDWDKDINYTSESNEIKYETGHSSQNVYNVYVNGTVEAGAVIESDSVERLLDSITDQLIENLKVNKGIDLRKLQ